MHTRYVPVTPEGVEALAAAAEHVSEDRLRQALSAPLRAYDSSTVACLHERTMRAGSSRKCCSCGSWL